MAVTNLYSNLPGHLVEFKDGGLQLTSSTVNTSSTKSLLILGTATDGPVNEPVKIDATTVSQVFGKEVDDNGYPNGATLTKYAKQAFKNGFDDVRCMRVTGSQAYATIFGQEVTSYEEKSAVINAGEEDTNGKIEGNAAFEYNFTELEGAEKTFVVPTQNENTEYILVNGETKVAATVNGAVQYLPYRGMRIAANQFAAVESLELHARSLTFIGENGEGIVKYQTLTMTASEDDSVVSCGGGDEDLIVSDGNGGIASIFNDKQAHTDYLSLGLPDLTGYNDAGFLVTVNGTDVAPTDYTLTVDNDGKVSIVFENGAAAASDTVVVKYYPYVVSNVTVNLTDAFNADVVDSTINVAVMADKRNAQIAAVTVYNADTDETTVIPASKYTVTNNVLTITDTTGLKVGSAITVSYKYESPVTSDVELKVKSQWGGSKYKTATVEVKKVVENAVEYTEIRLTRPTFQKVSPSTLVYSSKYIGTIDDLILAMKNDANNTNLFDIEIVRGEGTYDLDLMQPTNGAIALNQGGEDGLKPTNNEMFIALSGARYTASDVGTPINSYSTQLVTQDMIGFLKTQGAYQILENYNVDYIYPAGVYADSVQTVNEHSDFQRELALVCAVLTYRTKMTHGFIDVKPNSNTTLVGIDEYVGKLVNNHTNIYYMTDSDGNVIYDSENKPMDIGWYTSIVVGPEPVMTSDTLGTYYGSPAIAYAALNAVLEPQSSPLNKALRNVNGIKFKFSNKQLDALVGSRMVCFKLKNEGLATASSTPYVVDGITAGAPGCDYKEIVTVKVVTDVVDNIRKVADPFIGEQNTVEQRNALSALISKRLAKLVELGEIQSYSFEVSATIQQQLLGEASIALTIVPAMTLKQITTVVALRAAQ